MIWLRLFLISFLMNAYSIWDPALCIEDSVYLNSIYDARFLEEKNQIIHSLKGSWCSCEQAKLMMDLVALIRPQVVVEVGTFSGEFLLPIASALHFFRCGAVYGINGWSNDYEISYMSPSDINYQWWKEVDMQAAKERVLSIINEWNVSSCTKIIHKLPAEAVDDVPDIDFLHLLGGLTEEHALENVEKFLPKVKVGGYVLLSGIFQTMNGKLTKMPALWKLYNNCSLVCELNNSNTALFKKESL